MGTTGASPEQDFVAALTAQVEAAYVIAHTEITALNEKPEALRRAGQDPQSIAGWHALQQVVEMGDVVTEKLGGMVTEIDYAAITAAPDAAYDRLMDWHTRANTLGERVQRAVQQQEAENEQITAILGYTFAAGDDMIRQVREAQTKALAFDMPTENERLRLRRELMAADALFALAARPWPIPIARRFLPASPPTRLAVPAFKEPETAADIPPNEEPALLKRSGQAAPEVVYQSETPPPQPLQARRSRTRVSVPDFSGILGAAQVPHPTTHANIFTFAQPHETVPEIAADETDTTLTSAEPTIGQQKPAGEDVPQQKEPAATKERAKMALHERIAEFLEAHKDTFFLGDAITQAAYEGVESKNQKPENIVLEHFNHHSKKSAHLQTRWETAGLTLQRGKIAFAPGETYNPEGKKVVHKLVFRLVEAGTKKGLNHFDGRAVHWDRKYKFGAGATETYQAKQAQKPSGNLQNEVSSE